MFRKRINVLFFAILFMTTMLVCPMIKVSAAGYSGWYLNEAGWSYYQSGAKFTGWLLYNNKWYYLNPIANGNMVSNGWVKYNGLWYYFNSNGDMAVNTIIDSKYAIGLDGSWDNIVIQPTYFALLSDVPMPLYATYYDSEISSDNEKISYYYTYESLGSNFKDNYNIILNNQGWILSNNDTTTDGKAYSIYTKGSHTIMIGYDRNFVIIMGDIH